MLSVILTPTPSERAIHFLDIRDFVFYRVSVRDGHRVSVFRKCINDFLEHYLNIKPAVFVF